MPTLHEPEPCQKGVSRTAAQASALLEHGKAGRFEEGFTPVEALLKRMGVGAFA